MLINDILDRLKEHVEPKTDAALARALKVKPQSIVNWRKRGTFPLDEIHQFANKNKLSFDWLITGERKGGDQEFRYRDDNRFIHDKVETILVSDNEKAIDSFKHGLEGVLMTIEHKIKQEELIEKLIEANSRLTESLAGVVKQQPSLAGKIKLLKKHGGK